jgi:hypothetical protein
MISPDQFGRNWRWRFDARRSPAEPARQQAMRIPQSVATTGNSTKLAAPRDEYTRCVALR